MKYSVRVRLYLLPFFSLPSNSIADSFIYWGPCSSRNSFAGGFFCNTGDAGQELGTAPNWRSSTAWRHPSLRGQVRKQVILMPSMTKRLLVTYQRPQQTQKVQNQLNNPHHRLVGFERTRVTSIWSSQRGMKGVDAITSSFTIINLLHHSSNPE